MVREDVWYNFNFLKFTEAWFVTQDVVYPGECSMWRHLRRRRILLHLDGMSWRYQWDPPHLIYHLRLVFPYYHMQGEKTALRMGENNNKWSNRQRINLKNIQATPEAQFQKNKWLNQKMGQRSRDISPKKTYRWLTNTWKDAQHHSLSEKCK